MKVEFKPVSVIKTRLGIERYGPVHKNFASNCRDRMNARYVPEYNGFLTGTSFVNANCNIVYPQPYAHYLYVGKLYVDPKTKKGAFYSEDYGYWSRPGVKKEPTDTDLIYHKSGTGPYWDRKMVSAEIEDIIKETQELMKRGAR